MDDRMISKNRVVYADVLKIFASFSVVFLHVAAGGWGSADIVSYEWKVFNIYDSMLRFGVPVFVMASGMFLLRPVKNISIGDIYKKYIPRIVICFLSWSFLYAIYPVVSGKMQFEQEKFLREFIFGHYHMWYLYMIVGLYIITPILRKIVQDKKSSEYFIILSVVFAFVLPFAAKVFQLKDFEMFVRKFEVSMVLGYSGYFVLGYYMDTYELKSAARKIIYAAGIIGVAATAVFTSMTSLKSGKADGMFYSYLSPNVLVCSMAVFVFFRYSVSKINFGTKSLRAAGVLSACSFRIYLVHDFFNMFLYEWGISAMNYNPAISVPVIAALVFAMSFITSYIIGKIPFLNKIL
ncbi:O-acetyltransferase WecH [bioreactor metagenome]|uniref:O-acetyltransferase WecH n=1 Tax=bioreactor metagenome TaxID=1076179 RepID=A0A644XY63_9ZZZZ